MKFVSLLLLVLVLFLSLVLLVLLPAPTRAAGPAASPSVITDTHDAIVPMAADAFSQTTYLFEYNRPLESGGGIYQPGQLPALTEAQRQEIMSQVEQNVQRLNIPPADTAAAAAVKFAWPLQYVGPFRHGFHGGASYVDHNPAIPNQLRDYFCGARTYDLSSGYNHTGTDIGPWPFAWYMMDYDFIQVTAAAPGVIVAKKDGYYDRECSFTGKPANLVVVQHFDGSRAMYLHMKRGSLTPKPVGATVAEGEYLGVVGSSGNSTGPHLHFEVLDPGGRIIDPYAGPCNNLNAESWWAEQKPYYDMALNHLMTGNARPDFPNCDRETLHAANFFYPGSTIYFSAYFRDVQPGQVTEYTIYDPDGYIYQQWTSQASTYYRGSYSWWSYYISADQPQGTWTFEVVLNEQSYQHTFTVADGFSPDLAVHPGSLDLASPFRRASSVPQAVELWNPADAPLAIYQITAAEGEFSPDHNCPLSPATLPGGATCRVQVTFTPAETAPAAGTLLIYHQAGTSTVTITGTVLYPYESYVPVVLK